MHVTNFWRDNVVRPRYVVHVGSSRHRRREAEERAAMFDGLDGDRTSPPFDSSPFDIVDVTAQAVVVRVVGDLDLVTAPQLATHLRRRIESHTDGTAVVVDLGECDFL